MGPDVYFRFVRRINFLLHVDSPMLLIFLCEIVICRSLNERRIVGHFGQNIPGNVDSASLESCIRKFFQKNFFQPG